MAIVGFRAKRQGERTITTLSNIAPFFSWDFDDVYQDATNVSGYWIELSDAITKQDDGWAHVVMNNTSGSGPMYVPLYTKWVPSRWDEENSLTMLLEIKDYSGDSSGKCKFETLSQSTSSSGTILKAAISGNSQIIDKNASYRMTLNHVNSKETRNSMALARFVIELGYSAEFNARISLYQHEYTGDYQEYQEVT